MSLPLSRLALVAITGALLFSSSALCRAGDITSDDIAVGTLGSPFQYQITANNNPTSFDAVNLPPGLSLNRATGRISGVPNISGGHNTEVIAHGQDGDARANVFFLFYYPIPADDPHSGGYTEECISLLSDPNRPRIYCGGRYEELVVIATDTRTILTRIPNTGYIEDMSISADGQTLWFVRTYYYTSLARINLDTLDAFTPIPTSPPVASVREGLNGRLYAATRGNEVLQLDPMTGTILHRFEVGEGFPHDSGLALAISPDRRTLYAADSYYAEPYVTQSAVSRYDISTATPVFLQRVEMPAHRVRSLTPSPDGTSVYAVLGNLDGYGSPAIHQVLCLDAHNVAITKGAFSFRGTVAYSPAVTADSNRVVLPLYLHNGGELTTGLVSVFDARNFQLIKTIVLGTSIPIWVGDVALNENESSIFVATNLNPDTRTYPMASLPPPVVTPPRSLLNISTRMLTQNGDNVLIGGFIVTGTDPKEVVLRAIGPSLPMPGSLANPVLELRGPGGAIIAENDNWNSNRADVIETGIPPNDEYEAVILATLQPGAYTAILRGFAGASGIAAVEVYDVNPSANSRLANISTRGKVETGDNVMIGGWIIGGGESTGVVVRAVGPSLSVTGALADPMLAVYNGNGALLAQNDDWRLTQEQALLDLGLAPTDNRESAILLSLLPGNHTAIVRGKDDTTGVALVEVYNLQNP